MSDLHQVFARFRDNSSTLEPQREVLNVRRRGSANGTRTVEVVHVKSERSPVRDQPSRPTTVRAEAWSDGFPVKPAIVAPIESPAPQPLREPTAHILPAWQPSDPEPAPATASAQESGGRRAPARGRPPKIAAPDSADPFDDQDDGANCLRCGHRIQEARARRGLMTCGKCC